MLERFHVPADIAVHVRQEDMRGSVEDIFRKLGMSNDDAVQSADVLMYADIRGIESHGVSNMMRSYVDSFNNKRINPRPNWKIVREAPATATIDGDGGLGLAVGPQAMNVAIDKAKRYGIGAVAVFNSGHFGAAAYHAAMVLKHDMVGLSMTMGGTSVTPTWGAKAMLGLNPLAVAAPARKEPPFIFDASMSSVAGNKIRLAQRVGAKLNPGWIARPDGTPIMEETDVPEKYLMLPLGGTREIGSHKGYSLGMMIEVLAGLLSGNAAAFMRRQQTSHHFIAYNIASFTDVDGFKNDMDAYLKALKETPPAAGHRRVVYAGLPEHEEEVERRAHGIPYHPEVIGWFKGIVNELGLKDRLPSVPAGRPKG